MSKAKQNKFLKELGQHGIVGRALKTVNATRQDYDNWCNDGDFKARSAWAIEDAVDFAEDILRQRAVDGLPEEILYKGQPVYKRDPDTGELLLDAETGAPQPLTIKRRSDDLLKFYLQANRNKYQTNKAAVNLEATGEQVSGIQITFVNSDGDGRRATDREDDDLVE